MTSPTNSQNVKYLAINAARSPRIFIFEYTPNSTNWRGFQLLDEAYVPSTKKWYKLLSLAGNQADWQLQASDTSDFISEVVTDVGTAIPVNNSISLLGGAGLDTSAVGDIITINNDSLITLSTDAGTATANTNNISLLGGAGLDTSATGDTITINNDSLLTLTSDAGTATANTNNINIVGGSNITTSAVGDTVTIGVTSSVLEDVDTDSGTATVSGNTLKILGCTGLPTSGAGDTVSITASNTNHAPIVGTGSGFASTAAGTTGQIFMGSTGVDPVWNTIPTGVPYWNSPIAPNTIITSSYTWVETAPAPGVFTFTWTAPGLPAGQELYGLYFTVIVNSANFAGAGTYSLIVSHNVVSLMSLYAASIISTNITNLATHQTNNGYTSVLTLTGAANNTITVSCTNMSAGNNISISARYMGGSFGNF